MNNFVVRIVFVALGLAVAVPSLAGDAAAAPSPMAASTCSILMGGGGMVFADDAQNNKWFMVNRAVSSAVSSSLQNMGYHIDPLIVDIRDKAQRMKALATEVAREKCNRVIQITNGLSGESETMPGVAKDFEFDVSVLGVAADGKLTGLFQKTYSYPLTKEVMASLSMSEVGRTIATDIDQARVISKVPATVESNGQGK